MGWFGARCPVVAEEQAWIEDNLSWFVGQFGDSWLRSPVVLPTDDFFPGEYRGADEDIRRVVTTVCGYMGVDPERVRVDMFEQRDPSQVIEGIPGVASVGWSGAAGHYRTVDGKAFISLEDSRRRKPLALIATIAHELAHERLLGENRVAPDRVDQEPLTDLLTVFLGFGVFTANAALEFTHTAEPGSRYSRWSASRLGYLTEPMFGYALARYAWMREELDPDWARYVDTNPRTYLKKGLRFLRRSGEDVVSPVAGA